MMASNFPSSLDDFTNPTAQDSLNSDTVPHADQHANLNDAVEALEAKVGVDSSAVTTSHDYKIADHASRLATLESANYITALEQTQYIVLDSTVTVINFGAGTTMVDPSNWHDESTNPSRVTPTVAGLYRCFAKWEFQTSVADEVFASFLVNGSEPEGCEFAIAGTNIRGSMSNEFFFELNGSTDYVELEFYQDTTYTQPVDFQFVVQLVRAS
jgi:hypothetical protein